MRTGNAAVLAKVGRSGLARGVVALTAFLAACDEATAASTTDNLIEASATTTAELGVVVWSREDAGTSLVGLDAKERVILELQHSDVEDGIGRRHVYRLRIRESISMTEFWLGPDASGATTLALRGVRRAGGADVRHVLSRMRTDMEAAATSSLSKSALANVELLPKDFVDEKKPDLVCGTDIILIAGAESCLDHSSADDAWAQACAAQAKRTGASADRNTCWEQGDGNFNECICIDKSTATLSKSVCTNVRQSEAKMDRTTRTCRYVDGEGFEANACGKQCRKQTEICETVTVEVSGLSFINGQLVCL